MNEKHHNYIIEGKIDRLRDDFFRKSTDLELRRKRILLYILYTILLTSIVVIFFALDNSLFDDLAKTPFPFLVLFIASAAAGFSSFRYLQGGTFNISKYINSNVSNQKLRSEIQDLRFELLKLKKKGGEPSDYENVSKTINDAIDNTITEDFIKSKIDSFYSEKIISETKQKNILDEFEKLDYRISEELTRLRRSANVNLALGTFATLCAIFALGYEVFNNELEFSDTTKLLSHYIPRLSIVILIETFAFFFLKLYKATLVDIKYFNNEKTNIDFKIISLKVALNIGDDKVVQIMLEELIKTERNFKLAKNESTVELEKTKNETSNIQAVTLLLEKLSKK